MKIWSEITVVRAMRYLFLLLCIGGTFEVLFNLGAQLGIGHDNPMIRGWIQYGNAVIKPDLLPMGNGQIKVYNMVQMRFAFVEFNNLRDMLQGLPLIHLICLTLSEISIVLILYQMFQVFRSLDKGEVFRNNSIARIRYIAYLVVAFSVFTFLSSAMLAFFIQRSGPEIRLTAPVFGNDRVLLGILVALIIVALLKAFKLGAQLQQEQDLTI